MKREPPFKPHPTKPGEYLINLAGAVLMAGEAAYGNPAETTPEGQTAGRALIARFLAEAAAHGFKQGEILHALLRRNEPSARLVNLATDAMDCMPMELRNRIIDETFNSQAGSPVYLPTMGAVQPDPESLDPRFLAAGSELARIREEQGEEAVHLPENAHLLAAMHTHAPPELKSAMADKARAMGLLPGVTHVDASGRPVYSLEQVAATLGVTVEEIEKLTVEHADELEALGGVYTGPVHPLQ